MNIPSTSHDAASAHSQSERNLRHLEERDRGVSFDVVGGPCAPTQSRDIISWIARRLEKDVRDAVVLMTSELVTNSVVHGRTGSQDVLRLDVELTIGLIRVRVSDHGPGHIASPRSTHREIGGWGLVLVDRLSSRWGHDDGGRSAWFEMDLTRTGDTVDRQPASAEASAWAT